MTTSVYLVLEPQHDYSGRPTGMRFDRALTQPPKLGPKHIAVKVNLSIDSAAFEQWIPEATIDLADGRLLLTPDVSVEATTRLLGVARWRRIRRGEPSAPALTRATKAHGWTGEVAGAWPLARFAGV